MQGAVYHKMAQLADVICPSMAFQTPTGTPKQIRKTLGKDLEPTKVETEQNNNESPPIVVEKEVSGSCLFGKTVFIVFAEEHP